MKFRTGLVIFASGEHIKPNELSVKKQKELLDKHPHLSKFLIDDNDNERTSSDVEDEPEQSGSTSRKRKSSTK